MRCDVRGVFERASGDPWTEVFEKVAAGPLHARRFGPPIAAEAAALFAHVAPGSVVFTDHAAAYAQATANRGVTHFTVNHQAGVFSRIKVQDGAKPRVAGTQGLDGTWSLLRLFLRRHGNPVAGALPAHIDEYVWRRKLHGVDPFIHLLSAIAGADCEATPHHDPDRRTVRPAPSAARAHHNRIRTEG